MCGISGIVKKNGGKVSKSEIFKMNEIAKHRGPDREGIFIEDSIGLGHRRLSIIDLSELGNQPMEWQNLVITYNGEVYNYIEIRETLKDLGYVFKTNTDTEVILASYDYWGFECVKEFNGMWSFAIFDRSKSLLFCSRDRFGVKPFYYYVNENMFAFASEIKQLIDFPGCRKVNMERVSNYLIYGESENENSTFFDLILKLPGSHSLVYYIETAKYEINRYYNISFIEDYAKMNLEKASFKFKELLTDSIKLRLRSDVKVGSCLSGGLDSSTIVKIASDLQDKGSRLTSINAKSVDPQFDESKFAIQVAEISNSDLYITKPGIDDFKDCLEQVVYAQEEPFTSPSIIFQYLVFEEAKKQKCLVMLDGQGGDENLLGYSYHIGPFLINQGLINFLTNLKAIRRNSKTSFFNMFTQVLFTIFYKIPNNKIYIKRKNPILKEKIIRLKNEINRNERHKIFRSGSVFQWQKHEFFKGSIPALLRFEDKNSMAHSIESRLPFLDYRVVEFCLSVSSDYKIKDGWSKYLLRHSMKKNLPSSILWRRNKFGFNAPDKIWLSENEIINQEIRNSKLLDICIDKSKLANLKESLKWRVYNIALWEKIFSVEI